MDTKSSLGSLNIGSGLYKTRISSKFKNKKPYKPIDPKIILSFIPGTILDIFIKEGEEVRNGDTLMIIDAMKMKNVLKCVKDGKVKTIFVGKEDKVSKGTVLLEME
jgi:biotin carboxyl carrier protein